MVKPQSTTSEGALGGLQQTVATALKRARRGTSLRSRRRPTLAIEVTAESLRALAATRSGAGYALGRLQQVVVPEAIRGDPALRIRFLGRELRGLLRGLHSQDFVCVLPPGSVRSSIVTIPPLEGDDEIGALAVKLMKLISGHADPWAIDVAPLRDRAANGASPAEKRYLLSAVPRAYVEELVAVVAESGFLPSALTNAAVLFPSLERQHETDEALAGADDEEESSAWVVVQIRSARTGIHIYRHGTLEYSREIEWGGNDLTNALTDVVATPDGFIELSFDEAEQLKHRVGIPATDGEDSVDASVQLNASQMRMMLQPKLNTFVFELRNSIRYYQQASGCRRLARLTLTGGGSRIPGLDDFVHQQLKIRPHRFGPDDTEGSCESLTPEERATVFAQAPQLVAALQSSSFATDLTPAPVRMDRWLRRPFRVAMIVGCAAIVTCLALTHQLADNLAAAQARASTQDAPQDYEATRTTLETTLAEIDSQLADLQRVVGFGVPIGEILAELGRCTPSAVQLLRVSIEDQTRGSIMKVRGLIAAEATTSEQPSVALLKSFRDSPYFAEIEIESLQRQAERDFFEFTLALVPYSIDRSEQP
ncbi:MAG: pilus assembly protein PilM [Planctomycetota bacterium]